MIYNADCFDILPTLQDNSVDCIIIDPPYLVTEEKWDQKEIVNEELSKQLFRIAKDTTSLYVWCGIGEKSNSLFRWFPIFNQHWYFKDLITWKKQRGMGNKKGWLYVREECMWFVKDNKSFFWNESEQYDKKDKRLFTMPNNKSEYKRFTNVWSDIKEEAGSMQSCLYHPTQKPVELMKRLIKLSTKENEIVLDCFMGSGTTGISCYETKREFIGVEKDAEYFPLYDKRIRQLQGKGFTSIDKEKIKSLF